MSVTERSYQEVTERIVSLLKGGVVPWHKPWSVPGGEPQNLISRRPYRGINPFLLNLAPYASPFWLTFRQARKLGVRVRRSEKATRIWFWKLLDPPEEPGTQAEEFSSSGRRRIPILRRYSLFNVEQCEGLGDLVPQLPADERTPFERLKAAEAIITGMPSRPSIEHGGRGASYSPLTDCVRMPGRHRFKSGFAYYSTLYHELTHSTGHASRLDRKGVRATRFGSAIYGREELVAEMGAAFLSAEAGIEHATIEASASYLAGWIEKLNGDPRLAIQAAGAAQKAADFILGRALRSSDKSASSKFGSAAA